MSVKLSPSILSADFARLGEQVQEAIDGGADYIHVDIMDGQFVPPITIGPAVVKAIHPIAKAGGVPLDVHLMVDNPDQVIPAFVEAGAGIITVHVETTRHLHNTLQLIKNLGVKAGVTLNPATPLVTLEEVLTPALDMVLIMTVNPGFGGQSYIQNATAKIARLRKMLDERGLFDIDLEVDGGVKPENAAEVVAAGANVLVAGSAVYNNKASVADNIATLRRAVLAGA